MARGLMDGHWILSCFFNDVCLIAWDCSMVRVQIFLILGVATNSLMLILTIVESHWIFLKVILRIESALQLCPSPAIKVIELEVHYFTFQWLRDHLQPYLQEGRHEMCSFIFVKVWCSLLVSMDPEVVIGYISDSSEVVKVVTTYTSCCSTVGRIEPSGLSIQFGLCTGACGQCV
jgi:hypothetical protein